ncbi:2310_t:CDS:2, partial [Dentiscutata erythropus]
MSKYKVALISRGEILQDLHFGPNAKDWWISRPTNNDVTYTHLYPIRFGMKTLTTINQHVFIITVVQDGFESGYLCQSEALRSNVCKSSLEAVTSTYQQAFLKKTRFNGLLVMGFDDLEICKMLLTDIPFHPYTFKIRNNINLTVFGIGKSNNPDWKYARKGYQSSFVYNFRKTRALFFQKFSNKEAIVKIYQNSQEAYTFRDTDPNTVWNQIGILTQFTGSTIFGLEHEQTISEINKEQTLTCTVEDWQNEQIMNRLFNYHLKKFIVTSIEWKKFFIFWQNQESNIIELTTQLKKIYPPGYTIKDRELRAWKALLRHTGCTNITPFGKDSAVNPKISQHSILKSSWFVPLSYKSGTSSQRPTVDQLKSDEENICGNLLTLGWALKENQKFGKKGAGKRISKHVIAHLEGYFLASNANKSERYSAEEMHKELIDLAKEGSLEKNDIPKVSTIQNWIARYAAQHKQKMAKMIFQ